MHGLTLAIYPVHYDHLLQRSPLTDRALLFLTLRNIGLLALVAWAAACALTVVRASRPLDGNPSPGPWDVVRVQSRAHRRRR